MQILVFYYSKGGNTRKLAEAIAKGVKEVEGVDCVIKKASEVTNADFENSNGIIAGSPVYFGGMAAELKKVFDDCIGTRKKMEGKVGATFATSGDATGGKETTMMSIIQALLIYGMIIVGDPLSATGHYGVACVGAPDAKTEENAAKLGKRVAETAKKLFSCTCC
ncbi:MAG: NAD(P)H-dependent oxidoreductase [Desulfobacterales bacterium]|nr:NAD(P)H-dependent oxidoreductase [Desulfobacterales bacterium]